MRLKDKEVLVITRLFQELFLIGDQLWLFGSRVDDTQKGGDIDLFVQTQEQDADQVVQRKIKFLVALKREIGDQKIDLVVQYKYHDLPIYQHALETGIRLV